MNADDVKRTPGAASSEAAPPATIAAGEAMLERAKSVSRRIVERVSELTSPDFTPDEPTAEQPPLSPP